MLLNNLGLKYHACLVFSNLIDRIESYRGHRGGADRLHEEVNLIDRIESVARAPAIADSVDSLALNLIDRIESNISESERAREYNLIVNLIDRIESGFRGSTGGLPAGKRI